MFMRGGGPCYNNKISTINNKFEDNNTTSISADKALLDKIQPHNSTAHNMKNKVINNMENNNNNNISNNKRCILQRENQIQ